MRLLKNDLIEKTFVSGEFDFHKLRSKDNTGLLSDITRATDFLHLTASNAQRAWHCYHELFDYPLCSGGNKRTAFISFNQGYKPTCSSVDKKRSCNCWLEVDKKKKRTMVERFGVEFALQNAELKEKALCSLSSTLQVNGERIQEKRKQTCLKRYGVDYVFQSHELKSQSKKTNLERYGVDHFSKTDEYSQKIRDVSQIRFGVDHFSQSNEVIQKKKATCQNRFSSNSPAENEEIKNRIKQTNLVRYRCFDSINFYRIS